MRSQRTNPIAVFVGIAMFAVFCFSGDAAAVSLPGISAPKCVGHPNEVKACLDKSWNAANKVLGDAKGRWGEIAKIMPVPDPRIAKCLDEGGGKLKHTLDEFAQHKGAAVARVMRESLGGLSGKAQGLLKHPWNDASGKPLTLKTFTHVAWAEIEKEGTSDPVIKCLMEVAKPDWRKLDPALDEIDKGLVQRINALTAQATASMDKMGKNLFHHLVTDLQKQAKEASEIANARKPRSLSPDELYQLVDFTRTAASQRMISAARVKGYADGVSKLTAALDTGASASEFQSAIAALGDVKMDEAIMANVIVDVIKFEGRLRIRSEGSHIIDFALRTSKTLSANFTKGAITIVCGAVDSMNVQGCGVVAVGIEAFWDWIGSTAVREAALAAAETGLNALADRLVEPLTSALKSGNDATVDGVPVGHKLAGGLRDAVNLLMADVPATINAYNRSVRGVVKAASPTQYVKATGPTP